MRRIYWYYLLVCVTVAMAVAAPPLAAHSATQTIPAVSSPTLLTVPLWFLYVGSAICLLVAGIMLRRCQTAGKCHGFHKYHHRNY